MLPYVCKITQAFQQLPSTDLFLAFACMAYSLPTFTKVKGTFIASNLGQLLLQSLQRNQDQRLCTG